jgi:hypothetical protein
LESRESEDSPFFLPDGDLIYRGNRGGKNYLYTKKPDGTGEKRVIDEPILDVETLSPDGKWVIAARGSINDEEHPYQGAGISNRGRDAASDVPDILQGRLGRNRNAYVLQIHEW